MIRFRATFTGASGRSGSCEARANKRNGGAANIPADASSVLLRKLLRSVRCFVIQDEICSLSIRRIFGISVKPLECGGPTPLFLVSGRWQEQDAGDASSCRLPPAPAD